MGTSAFVSVGTAGSLQRDLTIGDLVLCDAAIRDEGVSHHYLPPAKLATAEARMTAAVGAALGQAGVPFRAGTSWTIDTPYRETVAEARRYQAEGVACVEMEAAALFAVAEVRGLRVSWPSPSRLPADLAWNPDSTKRRSARASSRCTRQRCAPCRPFPQTPGHREPGVIE